VIRSRRSKPRPGRLKGDDLTALRLACFMRDRGRCVVCEKRLHLDPRFDGDPDAYDMAHKRNKRMHGDSLGNVEAQCHRCHMNYHAGEKPCPAKPRSLSA
jgi:hypothetical protein